MQSVKQVIYEPHPVTPERKAELKQSGYQIIDIVFAPSGYERPMTEQGVIPADDIATLRGIASELGIGVDNRWGAKRLTDEIAKAKA